MLKGGKQFSQKCNYLEDFLCLRMIPIHRKICKLGLPTQVSVTALIIFVNLDFMGWQMRNRFRGERISMFSKVHWFNGLGSMFLSTSQKEALREKEKRLENEGVNESLFCRDNTLSVIIPLYCQQLSCGLLRVQSNCT